VFDKRLPTAKTPSFTMLKNSTNVLCSRCKDREKIGAKLSRPELRKEIFTVDDYTVSIKTRVDDLTNAQDVTEDSHLKTQYQVEIAWLCTQQNDPAAAYEARKTKLVKHAEEIKRLVKDTAPDKIAPIWQALALDNTQPAEPF